ncbi:MAG: tetratricopeptide repeat protein, partial [Bacteroidota bacterium]
MALLLWGLKPSSFLYGQFTVEVCPDCLQQSIQLDRDVKATTVTRLLPHAGIDALIACCKSNNCYLDVSRVLSTATTLSFNRSDYAWTIAYADRSYDWAVHHRDQLNFADYTNAVYNYAAVSLVMGIRRKSLRLQEEAIAIDVKEKNDDSMLAIGFENLGLTYRRIGDFNKALSYYDQALHKYLAVEGPDGKSVGRIYRLMGVAYSDQKERDKALLYFEKSLDKLDDHLGEFFYFQSYWYACLDIAKIHLEAGETDKALAFVKKGFREKEKKLFEFVSDLHQGYLVWGDILLARGASEAALSMYRKAEQTARVEFADFDQHRAIAICVGRQGRVYRQQERCDTALNYYNRALGLMVVDLEEAMNLTEALELTEERAAIWTDCPGEIDDEGLVSAFENAQQAISLVNEIRTDFSSEDTKLQLSERANDLVEQGIYFGNRLYQKTKAPKFLQAAFSFAEGNKATLLHELVQEELAKGNAGIPIELLEQGADLRDEMAYFKKQILEADQKIAAKKPEAQALQSWRNHLFELEEEYRTWVDQLERDYPNYYLKKYQNTAPSIAQLQAEVLPPRTAMVEFLVGEKESYAFWISRRDFRVYSLGPSDSLIHLVQQLRADISRRPSGGQFKANYQSFTHGAHQLYQLLFGPAPIGDADIDQLIILPDDILSLLPFEILLQEPAPPDPVIFHHDLRSGPIVDRPKT